MVTTKVRKRFSRAAKEIILPIRIETPKGKILKKGDYVFNTESGEEWLLLEDLKDDLSIRCLCTYVPAISRYKVGMYEEFKFYYKNGGLAFQWKIGKNKNH